MILTNSARKAVENERARARHRSGSVPHRRGERMTPAELKLALHALGLEFTIIEQTIGGELLFRDSRSPTWYGERDVVILNALSPRRVLSAWAAREERLRKAWEAMQAQPGDDGAALARELEWKP